MNNATFKFNYSPSENEEEKKIRNKYLPKEENKLETLKRLDYKVQTAGMVQALIMGIFGILIFGVGMCMCLEAISGGIALGLIFGVLGTAIMLLAYPIYRHIFNKTKKELTPGILELTNEILNNK